MGGCDMLAAMEKNAGGSVFGKGNSVHTTLWKNRRVLHMSDRVDKGVRSADSVMASTTYRRWTSPFSACGVQIKDDWETAAVGALEEGPLYLASLVRCDANNRMWFARSSKFVVLEGPIYLTDAFTIPRVISQCDPLVRVRLCPS